jgi:hypothetical protein
VKKFELKLKRFGNARSVSFSKTVETIPPSSQSAVDRRCCRSFNAAPNIFCLAEKRYGIEEGDGAALFFANRSGRCDSRGNFSFSEMDLSELHETVFRPLVLSQISRTAIEVRELAFAEIRAFDF